MRSFALRVVLLAAGLLWWNDLAYHWHGHELAQALRAARDAARATRDWVPLRLPVPAHQIEVLAPHQSHAVRERLRAGRAAPPWFTRLQLRLGTPGVWFVLFAEATAGETRIEFVPDLGACELRQHDGHWQLRVPA